MSRVQTESEPYWVAMSSAMNSSRASAGSGAYPRDGETRQINSAPDRISRTLIDARAGARETIGLGLDVSWLRKMLHLRRGRSRSLPDRSPPLFVGKRRKSRPGTLLGSTLREERRSLSDRSWRGELVVVRQIVIEAETPCDSRTMFRLRMDASAIADGLTAVQVHVLVGRSWSELRRRSQCAAPSSHPAAEAMFEAIGGPLAAVAEAQTEPSLAAAVIPLAKCLAKPHKQTSAFLAREIWRDRIGKMAGPASGRLALTRRCARLPQGSLLDRTVNRRPRLTARSAI